METTGGGGCVKNQLTIPCTSLEVELMETILLDSFNPSSVNVPCTSLEVELMETFAQPNLSLQYHSLHFFGSGTNGNNAVRNYHL